MIGDVLELRWLPRMGDPYQLTCSRRSSIRLVPLNRNSTHRMVQPRLGCFPARLSTPIRSVKTDATLEEHPCPLSSSQSWFGIGLGLLSVMGMPEKLGGRITEWIGHDVMLCSSSRLLPSTGLADSLAVVVELIEVVELFEFKATERAVGVLAESVDAN